MSENVTTSTTILNQAIEKVMDLIDALGLFAIVRRGALGTGNGICCEIGSTTPQTVWLTKHQFVPMDFTINGKHHNLQTLSEAMNTIHESLTMMRIYPSGNGWQIVDISTMSEPQIIGREDEGSWIMASSLLVKVATMDKTPEPEPEPTPTPVQDPVEEPGE
ncbi:MAG: hypothetical protein IIZ93_01520 [Acidaminococcaceae bacterium]|nr:hypothetical protein [Acidaminococcaceae bacterium]